MNYIYCFENKINGHKYIGQTNDLKVRYNAHKSQAYNSNSKDYNCLFHKKIREYGLENFDFYVLEEIDDSKDEDYIDFAESFWIDKLKSWCRYGKGYNQTTGGKQFHRNIKIDDDSINQIKKLLIETEKSFVELAEQFDTYRECIARINIGKYGFDNNLSYPLRITREWREISQEIKTQIAQEIISTKTSLKDIAKKYKISYHTINLLNQGKTNLQGNFTFPLRKTNTISQEQEDLILEGLKKGLRDCEIIKIANVSRNTVSNRRKKYNNLNL